MSIAVIRATSRLLSERLKKTTPPIVKRMKNDPQVLKAVQKTVLSGMKGACGNRFNRECSDSSSRQLYLRKKSWRKLHKNVQQWVESKLVNSKSLVLRRFFKRNRYKKITNSSGKRYIGQKGWSYRYFKKAFLPAVYNALIYKQIKIIGQTVPSAGPQKNKPSTPTLKNSDFEEIGKALKKTLTARGSLRGHKSIRALALAIKGKKLAWHKQLNHPAHLKLLQNLNKTMTGRARPGKMFPNKYSDSQTNQRIYGSWLLHRYVDHLTRRAPKLTSQQLTKIGAALEMTRRRYKRKIGHNALVPLTCALRLQLNVKWRWHKLSSRVHRYLVGALDKSMPSHLKPKTRYPVSAGFKRAYARWLLIQYVRYAKLKAPPAPTLILSDRQRRLYLKYAVLPALRKAGKRFIKKPIEARRYLIWARYKNLRTLPPGLDIKLSRYTGKLLKRRQFSSIRQEISDNRKLYCPSGSQKIMNAMYRDAIWNALAVADAKSTRQRANPATVKTVPLSPQQKRVVLAAVLKAVNDQLLQLGKKRFRNAAQARLYLRKSGWVWSRLGSSLDRKLTYELGRLLLGTKLGKLPKQLSKMGRGVPKTLYNSAVFDTNVGFITVAMRKLPSTAVVAKPTVALKPLQLSRRALSIARRKLLLAWNTNRTVHRNLPKYRNSKKLASYLKTNDDKLTRAEKGFLIEAFRNALNTGYLRSIKPEVKSLLQYEQTVFTKRVYIAVLKAAEGAAVVAKPIPPVRPRPVDKQLALQQGLVAAVRKVYDLSTSESAAKTVLKTQKWRTLKSLGIVGLIQKEFAALGYRKAAKNSYLAKLLVKKTLRNWKTSSDTTTPTPVAPTRPTPPRPSDKQIPRQSLLIASVRAVYGAATTESAAKTVLKTQKWSTLKQLGIAAYIMKGFAKLGYRRVSKSSYLAQRLVKKTLKNWTTSSGTTTRVTPARPTSAGITSAQRKAFVVAALLTALKTKGLASTPAESIAFAKGQKWSTVVALKLHAPFIAALNAESRLGTWRPQNSRSQTTAARKLYLSLKR